LRRICDLRIGVHGRKVCATCIHALTNHREAKDEYAKLQRSAALGPAVPRPAAQDESGPVVQLNPRKPLSLAVPQVNILRAAKYR